MQTVTQTEVVKRKGMKHGEVVPAELVALLTTCSVESNCQTAKLVAADWCGENDQHSLEHLLRWMADETLIPLFTGSRCYGRPKPTSDFDWVVLLMKEEVELLRYCADESATEKYGYGHFCIHRYSTPILTDALRFGPVNLLCCTDARQWAAWNIGTSNLLERCSKYGRPMTRNEACDEFATQAEEL